MTKDTLPSSAAMRRKLITGVAAMGTTLASRTIAPAATLLISAGSATAQAADPYADQPCSPGSNECGPPVIVPPPPDFDNEGSGGDLFGSNWIEPASWNTDPAAWIKPKNS